MNVISINCPQCGARSFVRSSRPLSSTMRELMFQCRVVPCSASWVATLEVSRMLSVGGLPNPHNPTPVSDRPEVERLMEIATLAPCPRSLHNESK
ncbi:DNA-binding transcriptional regulator [compost metagenome]